MTLNRKKVVGLGFLLIASTVVVLYFARGGDKWQDNEIKGCATRVGVSILKDTSRKVKHDKKAKELVVHPVANKVSLEQGKIKAILDDIGTVVADNDYENFYKYSKKFLDLLNGYENLPDEEKAVLISAFVSRRNTVKELIIGYCVEDLNRDFSEFLNDYLYAEEDTYMLDRVVDIFRKNIDLRRQKADLFPVYEQMFDESNDNKTVSSYAMQRVALIAFSEMSSYDSTQKLFLIYEQADLDSDLHEEVIYNILHLHSGTSIDFLKEVLMDGKVDKNEKMLAAKALSKIGDFKSAQVLLEWATKELTQKDSELLYELLLRPARRLSGREYLTKFVKKAPPGFIKQTVEKVLEKT